MVGMHNLWHGEKKVMSAMQAEYKVNLLTCGLLVYWGTWGHCLAEPNCKTFAALLNVLASS